MNRRAWELVLTIAGPLIILLVWESLSRLELINPLFWPAPSTLWPTAVDMFQNRDLMGDIGISTWRIVAGFTLAGTGEEPPMTNLLMLNA